MRKIKAKPKFNRTQWMVMMTDMRFGRVSILGIISLFCLTAISALWLRSFYKTDSWIWIRPMRGGIIALNDGYLNFATYQISDPRQAVGFSGEFYEDDPGALPVDNGLAWTNFAKFGAMGDLPAISNDFPAYRYRSARLPLWILEVIGLPFILRWVWKVVRLRHRKNHGECIQCGYDLRGTPNRCPECGIEVARSS